MAQRVLNELHGSADRNVMVVGGIPLLRLCLGLAACIPSLAQPGARPEFEVASLKASQSPGPARLTSNPGTWSCLNCRLFDLLGHAYKVFEYQIAAPEWTKSTTFDVVAKLPPGFKKAPWSTPADEDEFAVRMQSLLEGRFRMKVRRESREVPVYELVIARGGPKLKERSEPAPAPPPGPALDQDGFPNVPGGDGMRLLADRGRIQFGWQTMTHLAHFISTQVDRPVLDATGLKAHYALKLSWYRERASSGASSPVETLVDPPPGPTIFEAVQQQLGLRLQPKRGTVETVVIDHVEKSPIEN
jgi:uncharacterized protein (TIGR03435 family)